jgi:hypothetical protein
VKPGRHLGVPVQWKLVQVEGGDKKGIFKIALKIYKKIIPKCKSIRDLAGYVQVHSRKLKLKKQMDKTI